MLRFRFESQTNVEPMPGRWPAPAAASHDEVIVPCTRMPGGARSSRIFMLAGANPGRDSRSRNGRPQGLPRGPDPDSDALRHLRTRRSPFHQVPTLRFRPPTDTTGGRSHRPQNGRSDIRDLECRAARSLSGIDQPREVRPDAHDVDHHGAQWVAVLVVLPDPAQLRDDRARIGQPRQMPVQTKREEGVVSRHCQQGPIRKAPRRAPSLQEFGSAVDGVKPRDSRWSSSRGCSPSLRAKQRRQHRARPLGWSLHAVQRQAAAIRPRSGGRALRFRRPEKWPTREAVTSHGSGGQRERLPSMNRIEQAVPVCPITVFPSFARRSDWGLCLVNS